MLKILTVDDSQTIRRVIKNVLTRLIVDNIEIYEAGNGEEALQILDETPDIQLLLLDVNMPIMDGETLLKTLRTQNQYNNLRIIMVTTEAERQKVLRIMKNGANGFIVKPFTPESMRNSLKPILQRLGITLPILQK